MTFKDWVDNSIERYKTEPAVPATARNVRALFNGGKRRFGNVLGRPIWERDDWEVLVVLDACRLDLMQEVAPEYDTIPGEVGGVYSNASCSIDWILRNLNAHPDKMQRTGYITGNPFTNHGSEHVRSADLTDDELAYLAPLYKTEWGPVDGGPVETIQPESITDHAISAWRQREELGMDRMILHYMQPHQPYRSKPEWEKIAKNLKNLVNSEDMPGTCAWQRARKGEIDTDELWDAYRDNLRWVLDDVTERLLGNVDAKVAITADHGNAMGEWGEWAHPPGAIGPSVRKVPWISVNSPDLRTVTPGVDVGKTGLQNGHDTDTQLEALGYK